jgi:hypothetical protein
LAPHRPVEVSLGGQPDMTVPQNIPYNPRLKAIALFLGMATIGLAAGLMSVFPRRVGFLASAVFLSFASLLFLRRTVWRRQLALAQDSTTVPSGFLRLRPTGIRYEDIMRVWIHRVLVTLVICVKTADRRVEIPDIYLPNATTFHNLRRFLESTIQSRGKTIDETERTA